MRFLGTRARLGLVILATAIAATACVGGDDLPDIPSAERAAARLVAAWESADVEALARFDSTPGATSFVTDVEEALEAGEVSSFEVEVVGPITQPTAPAPSPSAPSTTEVPYSITYRSNASIDPVRFEGELQLAFDHGEQRWSADLDGSWLWPGEPDMAGFRIDHRWLKRGPIVDRNGKVLAAGRVEHRRYPQGITAGSVIGHIKSLTRADIKDGAQGNVGDLAGGSGMEELFQDRLAGVPTKILKGTSTAGKVIATFGRVRGRPGSKVRSTLDVRMQESAQSAFGSTLGGAVVLDPSTGDILAVADSAPFGPTNYVGAKDIEPFNRALSGLYPPGSSMKVVTAGAALDTKTVTADTRVTGPKEYKGVRNFESGEFGSITFATAVKFSVNTAFAQVAEEIGAKKLTRYADRFGFNSDPRVQAAVSSFPAPADLGDLMWSAVGQAQVVATPLQMASVAATVANDGVRMVPRIAKHQPKESQRVLRRKTARTLASLLEAVVEGGTGVGARIPGVRVAGKTGTAEVDIGGERKNHAWFISFAPVGAPKVAVAAVAELGGIGGQVAAPLVRNILQNVLGSAP